MTPERKGLLVYGAVAAAIWGLALYSLAAHPEPQRLTLARLCPKQP